MKSNSIKELEHQYECAVERNKTAPIGRKHQRQVETCQAATELLKAEVEANHA